MVRYIALLRGINVGGHRVTMERLRGLFSELGLRNVRSYINSGNIFFDTEDTNAKRVASTIEEHLHAALGYEVPTFLRTFDELETITSKDPFQDIPLTSDKRFCVVFTNQPLPAGITLPQQSSKQDMELIAMSTYEAFIVWRIIHGRPPSGKFAEGVLPASTTTRFYHTLVKILAAAKQ